MMERYILDADGNPVLCDDLMTWAHWMEDFDAHRRVAVTTIMEGKETVCVSTVFLGIDHGWDIDDPLTHRPTLWETMIFGGPRAGEMRRYTSREDALNGHYELVRALSNDVIH